MLREKLYPVRSTAHFKAASAGFLDFYLWSIVQNRDRKQNLLSGEIQRPHIRKVCIYPRAITFPFFFSLYFILFLPLLVLFISKLYKSLFCFNLSVCWWRTTRYIGGLDAVSLTARSLCIGSTVSLCTRHQSIVPTSQYTAYPFTIWIGRTPCGFTEFWTVSQQLEKDRVSCTYVGPKLNLTRIYISQAG